MSSARNAPQERPVTPTSWQNLFGRFEVNQSGLRFVGGTSTSEAGQPERTTPVAGLTICDQIFTGGEIEATFRFADRRGVCLAQVVLQYDPTTGEMLVAGFNADSEFQRFTIQKFRATSSQDELPWTTLATSPFAHRIEVPELVIRVVVVGSQVSVYANEVAVLKASLQVKLAQRPCGLFCQASQDIEVSRFHVKRRQPVAFVVMQYSSPFNELFTDVISPVASELGLDAKRADDTYGPGLIIADIVEQIAQADLIIAEITPANPNVFYEVGYAHASNKPTILIAERGKALPFDLSPFRTLFYENSIAGKKNFEEGLRRHINAIISR